MDDVAEAVSRATGTRLEYRNVSPGELRDILIAAGMDADHASFVVRSEEDAGPDIALDLVDSRADSKGVTIQVYRPAGRPQYAAAEARDIGDAQDGRPVPVVWPRPAHVGNEKYLAGLWIIVASGPSVWRSSSPPRGRSLQSEGRGAAQRCFWRSALR
jgi:hypothetical protein